MKRVTTSLVLAMAFLYAPAAMPVAAAEPASDLLPDLRMTVYGVRLVTSPKGRKKVHFGTLVANIGDGPIEVRAHGRDGKVMLNAIQMVRRTDKTMRAVKLPQVRLFYSGDGHNHFHIEQFNLARLIPVDVPGSTPEPERFLRKIGFCLFDSKPLDPSERPARSPRYAKYYDCGNRRSQAVRMGISVGHQDDYRPFIARQSILVDGMRPGRYMLCVATNPAGIFLEKPDSFGNNAYWYLLDIDISKNSLQVVDSGNSAC